MLNSVNSEYSAEEKWDVYCAYNDLLLDYDELKAENAELQKLVKRMFDRVNYVCRCCSVFCPDWDKGNECCVFTTLMHKLGIKEDE
jgi:hypothetical protein